MNDANSPVIRSGNNTDGRDPGISMLGIANVLLRHSRLLIGIPVGGMLAGILFAAVQDEPYRAESAFMVRGNDASTSRFNGLAAQMGLDLGGSTAGLSPDIYVVVARSRPLLEQAVATEYTVVDAETGVSRTATLVDLYGIDGPTAEARQRAASALLSEGVSVSRDPGTGILHLRTEAPFPDLAVALNRRILQLLNDFNVSWQQSQATAERRFIEKRMQEARDELRAAEQAMERFLQQNRHYRESPPLMFEAGRLEQRVLLRQQVFTSLAESFEQARIAEVKALPALSLVEHPEGSASRVSRHYLVFAVLGIVVGGMLSATLILFREYSEHQRRSNAREFAEFQSLRRGAVRRMFARSH